MLCDKGNCRVSQQKSCKVTLVALQARVVVSQPADGRVWVEAARVVQYGQEDTSLGLAGECDEYGDRVTVWDGPGLPGAARPAKLLSFCRGGAVPAITTSGPDLLLQFSSSPHAAPASSPYAVTGFQLEIKIRRVATSQSVSVTTNQSV